MRHSIPLLLVTLMAISCQREFEVDNSNYKPKLVINNLFQQNTPFEVVVSHSVNIYDTTQPAYVKTATVKLFVNGAYAETLTPFGQGYYSANTIPTAGNTYKMTVTHPDYAEIEAENKLPNPVQIATWYYIDSTSKDNNGDWFGDLSFTINDPSEENDYLLSVKFWDVVSAQYIYLASFESDDEALNASLAKRMENGEYLFTDDLFNGTRKTFILKIPSGYYQTDPNYLLSLYSLSKDAYFYEYTKPDDVNLGTINTTPIYTNVKNGLGIFAGRSLDTDTIK
jgi:hypothetical protein